MSEKNTGMMGNRSDLIIFLNLIVITYYRPQAGSTLLCLDGNYTAGLYEDATGIILKHEV